MFVSKRATKCRTHEKKKYSESGKSEMSSETKASEKMKPKDDDQDEDEGKGKRYFARFAFQSHISNHKFEAHTKHSLSLSLTQQSRGQSVGGRGAAVEDPISGSPSL